MIRKILFEHQNKLQLIIAFFGALLGLLFLQLSFHYLIRIIEFGDGEESLQRNALIVQKKVTNFSSTALSKNNFSSSEINYLQKQGYITEVAPIKNNNFGVSLQTDSELVPYFRSDIFVQAIPSDFLNIVDENWNWNEDDEHVPIILPRDFLVMLNTFASAKGIPQVSEDLAKSIGFKFTLYNDENKAWKKVKIIGFTSQVSSILVPDSFMEYGNMHFSTGGEAKITQVMVNLKDGTFGEFEQLMKERSLEGKESEMIVGKLKSIATLLFSVLLGVACFVIGLSGLLFIQYNQLILAKNEYTITTLLRIGYHPKAITKAVSVYFIRLFFILLVSSSALFLISKRMLDYQLLKAGISISTSYSIVSFLGVIAALFLYTFFTHWSAQKEVYVKR